MALDFLGGAAARAEPASELCGRRDEQELSSPVSSVRGVLLGQRGKHKISGGSIPAGGSLGPGRRGEHKLHIHAGKPIGKGTGKEDGGGKQKLGAWSLGTIMVAALRLKQEESRNQARRG